MLVGSLSSMLGVLPAGRAIPSIILLLRDVNTEGTMNWLYLLAQGEGATPEGGAPPWAGMMPIILMFGTLILFMFVMSRRQRRQQEDMLAAIKKNDEVVTSAGLIGKVVSIRDSKDGRPAEVVLKVDADTNTRVRVLKSSITTIMASAQSGSTDKANPQDTSATTNAEQK